MPLKKNATPIKSLEDSSTTHEESEDMSFWVSQLESLVKAFVSKGDLEESMNILKTKLEKNMEGLMKTLDLDNIQTQMEENVIKL